MGVEPTRDSDYCPADGFEDREAHRDPSASMGNATGRRSGRSPTALYSIVFGTPLAGVSPCS